MEGLSSKLIELINQVQELAPSVWEAARRQVLIDAEVADAWKWLWIIMAAICGVITIWLWVKCATTRYDGSDWGMPAACMTIITIVLIIIGARTGTNAYVMRANPDWYAIQMLLKQLTTAVK